MKTLPQPDLLDRIAAAPPSEPCEGVEILEDREIRSATPGVPRQHATIYRPVTRRPSPAPAVLAFHGGAFTLGHPTAMGAAAKALALILDITTVSVSYRLGTPNRPTTAAILVDAMSAWAWMQRHASELGLDPANIAVAGESAGCLLAGHLAVDSPWVRRNGHPPPAAFYASWGPLDFVARWHDNGRRPGAEVNILGPGGFDEHPALYHQLSTLSHIRGQALPPALFIYGTTDTVVHARQAHLGLSAWHGAGAHAEALLLPNIGHGVVGDNTPQRRTILERTVAFASRWQAGVKELP